MKNCGIINVRKPRGLTSHDVTGKVRRKIGGRTKVGHTGTLDPMAEGVLPVCIGSAARVMQFLDLDLKSYRCEMKLGIETDTQDIWGTEIRRADEADIDRVTEEDLRRILESFRGVIQQMPPLYSAVKIDGKKLYEYARDGEALPEGVRPRTVCIPEILLEEAELGRGYGSRAVFSLSCTKGTYVRSVCHDAGEKLGVPAVMSGLVRTSSGPFRIEDAVPLDQLMEMDRSHLEACVLPPEAALTNFGEVIFPPEYARKLVNGLRVMERFVTVTKQPPYAQKDFWLPMDERYRRTYLAYDPSGTFLGVVRTEQDAKYGRVFRPVKIFLQGGYKA